MIEKIRGFEVVEDGFRKFLNHDIILPTRGTRYSAGYDFHSNETVDILPGKKHMFWMDVKVYMQLNEVFKIYIRSSIANKKDIIMKNQVGIVDADYYSITDSDGNIGITLYNSSDTTVRISQGERIAQGIFEQYFKADGDEVSTERTGGFGSTNK